MSVCDHTSDLCALSGELWSIVKEDKTHEFPNAVQIAIKLFKAFSNNISSSAFCDVILDLKIKALIPVMSEEEFSYPKVLSLLNYLFPVKEEDMAIKSSKYRVRHQKVRRRLLKLLQEDESRMIYIRDYLKYGSCGCLTRVIQERVKQFIDVVNELIATPRVNKSVVTRGTRVEKTSPSMSPSSFKSFTSGLETKQDIPDMLSGIKTCHDGIQLSSHTSASQSGCVKVLKRNVEHTKQEITDLQSRESMHKEASVRSNHDRNQSQSNTLDVINEYNRCKQRKVERGEEVMGGVANATLKSMKKKEDLASEREKDRSDDANEDKDCTKQTAKHFENSSPAQEPTVLFGIPGSYSSCTMT